MDAVETVNPPAPVLTGGFQPPPGYVLLPQAVYDMLVNQANAPRTPPVPAVPQTDKPVLLHVLRSWHLGDVKCNLIEDETIEWFPRRKIIVRGKEFPQMGSFLGIWNKQDPTSMQFDPNWIPLFEVENPEVLDAHNKKAATPRTRQTVSESRRIAAEEETGDACNTPQQVLGLGTVKGTRPLRMTPQAPVPVPQAAPEVEGGLPPRGSEARRDLIHSGAMDRQQQVEAARGGMVHRTENVSDFAVSVVPQDQRTVAKIPGQAALDTQVNPSGAKVPARRRR